MEGDKRFLSSGRHTSSRVCPQHLALLIVLLERYPLHIRRLSTASSHQMAWPVSTQRSLHTFQLQWETKTFGRI